MVSINVKTASGRNFKVKFYGNETPERKGIYTITDSNGEHELGTWEAKPLLVGKHLKPSKDRNSVIYLATSFRSSRIGLPTRNGYTMRELAQRLISYELIHNTIN